MAGDVMQEGPWQIALILGVAALVVLPFSAFLLRQACSIFGEGMPEYRRAMIVALFSAGGAYLAWDCGSFAMVKMAKEAACRDQWIENQAILAQRMAWLDQLGYSGWARLPIGLRVEMAARVPGVSRLPFVFGLCVAGVVAVLGLGVPFRKALGIVLVQWLLVVVLVAVGHFGISSFMRLAWPGIASMPAVVDARERARQVWDKALPEQAREITAEAATGLKPWIAAAEAASAEAGAMVEPYQARMMEQLDPFIRWLPDPARDFLAKGGIWLVAAMATLVILIWLRGMSRRLWKALRKKNTGRKKPVKLQIVNLGDIPRSGASQGGRRLTVKQLPARLRAVVLAPAGSDAGELHRGMAEAILDHALPGLGDIADHDNPLVTIWPRQYSLDGFQQAFFSHVTRPDGDHKRSRFALLAGPITMGRFTIHAGLALDCGETCALGNIRVGKDKWADAIAATREG